MSNKISDIDSDISSWYTEVVTKAGLADYGPVKGTMVIKPYGYSLWTLIKESIDLKLKKTGHSNAYFPLFIPKSFLSKEAEHVEGFAKECAVITHHRLKTDPNSNDLIVDPDSKLEEEVIVRPTSETVIWSMYKKWIQSYRDLPILLNQWANVVRWEMRTRLFLRTTEFLWQEGHTAHSNEIEAKKEAIDILNLYKDVSENIMAIPVLTGIKSEAEKFAGAEITYCIESMMGDKKALQAGTSHYLGQNFAKAFDVKFQTKNNKEDYVYATSWGVSTRLIGSAIMVHGDDKGLRLPPKIAPHQIVIIPIGKSDDDIKKILNFFNEHIKNFKDSGLRVLIDDREDLSPAFKFNEWEMKGVPIRIEVGFRDLNNDQVTIARRDTNKKEIVSISKVNERIHNLIDEIQISLFEQALDFMNSNIFEVNSYEEFKKLMSENKGFIKCGWDGNSKTELIIKEETKATIRCIPFEQNIKNKKCIFSGKPAKFEVIFAKSY